MRKMIMTLLAASAAGLLPQSDVLAVDPAGGAELRASKTDSLRFVMPGDPSIPVITMAFVNLNWNPPPVKELAIFPDGRVTATIDAVSHRMITAQLPESEWEKIQKMLFDEHDLLRFETNALDEMIDSLRRQRQRPQPGPEADVTIITIRGEDFLHEVKCHAVGLTATQLPDLPEIQSLFACQQCLQNVVHVVRAGGYERVHRTLESVNTRLERKLPGCGPLCSQDLRLVDSHPDGTRYLQFARGPYLSESRGQNLGGLQSDEQFLMVSVYERPGRPLEISIIGESVPQ